MVRERPAQLREGYVCVAEAARLAGLASPQTVHFWIQKKQIRARRVGMGKFAPWYVSLWDLLALHNAADGAWIEGSDINAVRETIRRFIAAAIRDGALKKLQDGQPIAEALAEEQAAT